MSDNEFDVMDQLYFVTSYNELKEVSGLEDKLIEAILWGFIKNDWVKCLKDPEVEVEVDEVAFEKNYTNYYYLASKAGLLAHNLS